MGKKDRRILIAALGLAGVILALVSAGGAMLIMAGGSAFSPMRLLWGDNATQRGDSAIIFATLEVETPRPTEAAPPTAGLMSPTSTPSSAELSSPMEVEVPAVTAMPTETQGTATPQPPRDEAETLSSAAPTVTVAPAQSEDPAVPPTAAGTATPEEVVSTEVATIAPSETPAAAPDETSPGDAVPSEDEVPSPDGPAPPPLPSATFDDLTDLEAYMRLHRSSIAGEPLDIVSLTLDAAHDTMPRFTLAVAASEASDVLAAQAATDIVAYGERLLDDVKRYLGNESCEIAVESTYPATSVDPCSQAPRWCTVGDADPTTGVQHVTRVYVRGRYAEGIDAIEAWNVSP